MTRTLLIGVAALSCACGGSHPADRSAQSGAVSTAGAASAGDQGGATQTNQTVTLLGCLVGPGQPQPTGTSGVAGGASADRFMLVDAVVPGADLGGVGANGAGGSGGPLVSGRASFELDGVPPAARANVNKQVKVVGRLDARPAPAGGETAASTGQKSVAGHGTMASAARSDVRSQQLVVESVEVVADPCERR